MFPDADAAFMKDLLPKQESPSTTCPSPELWEKPSLIISESPSFLPTLSPQLPSESPSSVPDPHHTLSPEPRLDQGLRLTSIASPQQRSNPLHEVSSLDPSVRPVLCPTQNPSTSCRPSFLGINGKTTMNSLHGRAPQLSYVEFGMGEKPPSQFNKSSNPSPDSTPSEVSRKRRSIVWTEFEQKMIDGREYAICNTCNSKLTSGSRYGTRHLHSHMERCKKGKTFELRQQIPQTNKGSNKGKAEKTFYLKQQIPQINKGSNERKVELHCHSFDQEVSRRDIVNAIILHGYPLDIVNHYGFKKFASGLQPKFKMVSRNTIKMDIAKIFDSERNKLMYLLEKLDGRVAIATDICTAKPTGKNYMAITAHFIDEAWVLQSRLVRFIYIPHPQNAKEVAEYLMDALLELSLDRKLSSITVDNATTSDAISIIHGKLDVSSLLLNGSLLLMHCCRNILNLVVRDGLEVISGEIEKVRSSVIFWTASPQRVDEFKEACHHLCVPYTKKLHLDDAIHWNSTLLMLQTAILYKDVFVWLKHQETYHTNLPSECEWISVKEIREKLQLFYNMKELFLVTASSTLNCYFPKFCEIKVAISKWIDSPHEIVQVMASQMTKKYDEYWSVCHHMIGIACVFDPRYKLKLVEYYFKIIYGDEASVYVSEVRDDCYALQLEYESKGGLMSHGVRASVSCSPMLMEYNEEDDPLINFDLYVASHVPVKSELDLYLEECVLPRSGNFDVLSWWKTNGIKFPTLQKIASDILAIPASSAAPKSALSNDMLFSSHHSRLSNTTMEALMCTHNWARVEVDAVNSSCTQFFSSTHHEDDVEDDHSDDNDYDKDNDDVDDNKKNH